MKDEIERIADIADSPLKHLERRYSELSAAMNQAGEHAEKMASEAITDDEKLAQIVVMTHSKGIASGLELAATEIGKARQILKEALDEVRRNIDDA